MSRDRRGPDGQPLSITTSGIPSTQYAGDGTDIAGAGINAVAKDKGSSTAHSAPVRRPSNQTRQIAASIRKHSLPPPPKAPPPPPPPGRHQRAQYPLETSTTLQSPCSDYSEQGDFFVEMSNRPQVPVDLRERTYPNRPPSAYLNSFPRLSHQRLQSEPLAQPKVARTNTPSIHLHSRRPLSVPMIVTPEGRKPLPLYVEAGKPTHTRIPSEDSVTSTRPKSTGTKITSFFSNLTSAGNNNATKPVNEFHRSASISSATPSRKLFDSFTAMNAATASGATSPPASAHSSNYSRSRSISTIAQEHMPEWPSTPSISSDAAMKISGLEAELAEVARELAVSINREMELENLVETLQSQNNNANNNINNNNEEMSYFANRGHFRQTSDYYSDETSDRGEPSLENDDGSPQRPRGEDRAKPHNSDEKAKLAAAEARIQALEAELAEARASNARLTDLEELVESTKRHLEEERQQRENFEELLKTLRADLEQYRNERDQLRDEIIPQLRSEAQEKRKTMDDATSLKGDNETLKESLKSSQAELSDLHQQKSQMEGKHQIGSIAEEGQDGSTFATTPTRSRGITRSNTYGPTSSTGARSSSAPMTRSRSGSRKGAVIELAEDAEMQRKLLHETVKSLLERQVHEERKHKKQVKEMQAEITRLRMGRKVRGLRANCESTEIEEKGKSSPLPLKMGRYPVHANPFEESN
ncbi:hypothetical protein KEM56_006681 [Ascosphaera pollenicola]|nr:hypothetical protein KEM56_006681 [Ascosphaera pollenicola]